MSTNGNKTEDLLEVKNLQKYFPIKGGILQRTVAHVKAVDGVSFTVKKGETLGLVGESGCGKTTVGRTILRLTPATGGSVIFEGQDVFKLNSSQLKALRRDMQIIFQDPYSSLDPRMPVGESVGEGLLVHGMRDAKKRNEIVIEMLRKVGLEDYHARRYPHEFSGGQRQRIGIARALDVSIQSQVLNILKDLQAEFGLTYLFIAHNLSVVEHISDRVGVMYLGKMVELTDRDTLFRDPLHPYTKALLSAIPIPDPTIKRERMILQGDVPSPVNPPSGCRFHTRCPFAVDICKTVEPSLEELKPGHLVACHVAKEQVAEQKRTMGIGAAITTPTPEPPVTNPSAARPDSQS